MRKYYFTIGVAALILIAGVLPSIAQNGDRGGDRPYFRVISPANGQVLRAGQQIGMKWIHKIDASILTDPYGEMEIFLQTVEGAYIRLTPALSPTASTFLWTVPAVETRSAKLVLRAGIEAEGDFYNLPSSANFSIKTDSRSPVILLNSMAKDIKSGTEMELTWTSNLEQGTLFDVMISYDRGAHYFRAGSTVENRFVFPVEEDFSGSITVKISNRRLDGTVISSPVNKDATIRVGVDADR